MQMAYSTLDDFEGAKRSGRTSLSHGLANRPALAFGQFPANHLLYRWLAAHIRDEWILPRLFLRLAAQTRIDYSSTVPSSAACEKGLPFTVSDGVF